MSQDYFKQNLKLITVSDKTNQPLSVQSIKEKLNSISRKRLDRCSMKVIVLQKKLTKV